MNRDSYTTSRDTILLSLGQVSPFPFAQTSVRGFATSLFWRWHRKTV